MEKPRRKAGFCLGGLTVEERQHHHREVIRSQEHIKEKPECDILRTITQTQDSCISLAIFFPGTWHCALVL